MLYLQRKGADTLISGTQAPDTGLHRKEQAAPIDSVQELRLLRDGTHCIRCRCTFFRFSCPAPTALSPGEGYRPFGPVPIKLRRGTVLPRRQPRRTAKDPAPLGADFVRLDSERELRPPVIAGRATH